MAKGGKIKGFKKAASRGVFLKDLRAPSFLKGLSQRYPRIHSLKCLYISLQEPHFQWL